MEPIKILVVDDEPNIRDLLASGLRFAGFSVLAVGNGNDAVTAAEKGKPDLILLDVMLPDMSGFSVTKKLRSMKILAPVLFLTARDEVEDKITGLTVGGDDYMTKPFSIDEVIARINAILRRTRKQDIEESIFEVQVPMEDVVEIKNGQRKLVTRVRIPSYVLVRMDLNEDSWSCVRHTPGVTGFVGNAHNPTPLRFQEAFNMLKPLVEVKDVPTAKAVQAKGGQAVARTPIAEIDFEIGETVVIKEGSFAGLPGTINEIKPESGKLTVLVSLFERETPVELSFDQVTKQ